MFSRILGAAYAVQGGPVLRISRHRYFRSGDQIPLRRRNQFHGAASLVVFARAVVDLAAASFGARLGGLTSFVEGWVVAIYLEALVMGLLDLLGFRRTGSSQARPTFMAVVALARRRS